MLDKNKKSNDCQGRNNKEIYGQAFKQKKGGKTWIYL
jgi:hypothetical protein